MKNLLVLSFFLLSLFAFSQEKGYTIHTKNGATFFTKKFETHKDEISFKTTKEKQKVPYHELEKIVSTGKKEKDNYTKRYIYYSEKAGTLMEELVDGKVSLYKRMELKPTGGGAMGPTYMNFTSYYIKRAGEKVAVNTGINDILKNYKKTSNEFFSDCPALISKLENKEFKKKEVEDVVIFYNENCVN